MFEVGHKVSEATRRKISEARKSQAPPRPKGFKMSEEQKRKIGLANKGNTMPEHQRKFLKELHWKAPDELTYSGVHSWLRREFGRPFKCEFEDTSCKGDMTWASVEGNYIRDIKEFMSLCRSHHIRFDRNNPKRKVAK